MFYPEDCQAQMLLANLSPSQAVPPGWILCSSGVIFSTGLVGNADCNGLPRSAAQGHWVAQAVFSLLANTFLMAIFPWGCCSGYWSSSKRVPKGCFKAGRRRRRMMGLQGSKPIPALNNNGAAKKIPKLTFTFQTLITAKQITVIILFAYFVK